MISMPKSSIKSNSKTSPLRISRKMYVLLSLILFTLAISVLYYLYFLPRVSKKSPLIMDSLESRIKEQSERVIQQVNEKDYTQIKAENPDVVLGPNVADAELKGKIQEVRNNSEPQNYRVFITNLSLEPKELIINEGDLVTWSNDSKSTIKIVGNNNWESAEREPGQLFTQEFTFNGVYTYKVFAGNDILLEGSIEVTSTTQ